MAEGRAETYFDLPLGDQAELLQSLAPMMGRRSEILEKDIWLCQVLEVLFRLPCRKPMAFKGGTSLSKVYRAIDRFSEDIDVTIDYRSLVASAPALEALTSNTQRKKLSNDLKTALTSHVIEELVPALREALALALPGQSTRMEVSDDAEKLWVYYPSAVENADAYLRPSVLIEFGGRNSTLPQSAKALTPDIATHVPGLAWPVAHVAVLSAARTFWEKATLIHVECHRPGLKPSADRLSRHWYDLARLADHEVGQQAVSDPNCCATSCASRKPSTAVATAITTDAWRVACDSYRASPCWRHWRRITNKCCLPRCSTATRCDLTPSWSGCNAWRLTPTAANDPVDAARGPIQSQPPPIGRPLRLMSGPRA